MAQGKTRGGKTRGGSRQTMIGAGVAADGGATANIHPVCFSGRRRPAGTDFYVPSSPAPDDVPARWELSDQCVEAFARLVPLLACGEESAIHVFSGAAALAALEPTLESSLEPTLQCNGNGYTPPSVSAQALAGIAADEMRHEAWLAAWRARLPDCLDLATRRQARRFFAGLACDDPALHFIRIAALDSAVCQILAPLIAREAPLSGVKGIRITLNRILTDEARHVRISRACATASGATPEQVRAEWQDVRVRLATLLESVGPDLAILGADPDKLFDRLKRFPQLLRFPQFPAAGSR